MTDASTSSLDNGRGARPEIRSHLFSPRRPAVFHREDWRRLGGRRRWEAGVWGMPARPGESGGRKRGPRPACFPHAGPRRSTHEDGLAVGLNGETGTRGFGNHKHNDLLSFRIHAEGRPWIVDRGYVYTGDPGAEPAPRRRSIRRFNWVTSEQAKCVRQALPDPQPLHRRHLKCRAEPGCLKSIVDSIVAVPAAPGASTEPSPLRDGDRLALDDRHRLVRGPSPRSRSTGPAVSANIDDPGKVTLDRASRPPGARSASSGGPPGSGVRLLPHRRKRAPSTCPLHPPSGARVSRCSVHAGALETGTAS